MKILYSYFIIVLITFPIALLSQSINEIELESLAQDLVKKLSKQLQGENIAIADFVDKNDAPSDLGRYLAEEFSYSIVNNLTETSNINIVDRTHIKRLGEETGRASKGMIDSESIRKLGNLAGVTAIVYGKLIPVGNYMRVYIKAVILESQVNEVTVVGKLTITETLKTLMSQKENIVNYTSPPTESQSSEMIPTTTNQHIQISSQGCKKNGSFVDCTLSITSLGRSEIFSIQANGTRAIDGTGYNYRAAILSMGGKSSSIQVQQTLQANIPASALIRFSGIPRSINHLTALEISAKPASAYAFKAQLNSIPIN